MGNLTEKIKDWKSFILELRRTAEKDDQNII